MPSSTLSLGSFELDFPIGKGGMCDVWQGFHSQHQESVAIKIAHAGACEMPGFINAFYDEARTLAGLSHPGIVRVYELARIPKEAADASNGALPEGSPYIVMERATRSLKPYSGNLPWIALRKILLLLLDALAHAHARGIIHRDIKPHNILVFSSVLDVKLTDFGIAHTLESEGSDGLPEFVEGTPSYMAPEQFTGLWRDYGPWTDLYALGCTAFELACGHPPFHHHKTLRELFIAHVTEEVTALPEGCDVPDGFFGWLQGLLAKQPHHRFACAADAKRALEAVGTEQESQYLWEATNTSIEPPTLPMVEAVPIELVDAMSPWGEVTLFDAGEMRATLQTLRVESVSSAEEVRQFHEALSESTPPSDSVHESGNVWSSTYSAYSAQELWLQEPSMQEAARANSRDVGLSLFAYRALPLIGRERERSTLWEWLVRTYRLRQARLLQLWGASGLGKSRLVRWLCEQGYTRGIAHVLKALHSPNAGAFHGLQAMLLRHLRCVGLSHEEIHKRLQQKLPEEAVLEGHGYKALAEFLSPVSAEKSDSVYTPQLQSIEEKHAVLYAYLRYLSLKKPVILWLEDIHWGLDTLQFVSYVMKQQKRAPLPILLLAIVREDAILSHSFESEQLRDLLAYADTLAMNIGPLNDVHREQFVRALGLHPSLATHVQHQTAGNPMFAMQLVGDWVEQDMLLPTERGLVLQNALKTSIPKSLRELWTERVERILQASEPSMGRALELAACLGQIVDYQEWRSVCEQAGIATSTEFVEFLLLHQLGHWDDETLQSWSFTDGFVRDVFKQRARLGGREEEHHFYCAAALLKKRSTPGMRERLARHYWLAGAHNAALAAFLKAIWEHFDTGALRSAQSLFEEWESLLHEFDLLSHHTYWGELELLKARFARNRNTYSIALKHAENVYLNAKKHNWKLLRLRALLELGYLGWRAGYARNQIEVCLQQAEALAIQLNERRLLARSRCITGDYFNFHGKPDQAIGFFKRALDVSVELKDYEGMGRACLGLAWSYRQQNQIDTARLELREALTYFRLCGSREGTARGLSTLGDLARLEGQLETAEQHYRESMHHYTVIGSGDVGLCELNLSFVLILQSKFELLEEYLRPALESFSEGGRKDLEAAACMGFVILAGVRDAWDAWDVYYKRADMLLNETGVFDVDHAMLATQAGWIAQQKGHFRRAKQMYLIAYEQWLALKRDDQIQWMEALLHSKPFVSLRKG